MRAHISVTGEVFLVALSDGTEARWPLTTTLQALFTTLTAGPRDSVTVAFNEPYTWEWRRKNTEDILTCVTNGYEYAEITVPALSTSYALREENLRRSGYWRPDDTIRPRPRSVVMVLLDQGFGWREDTLYRNGKVASFGDWEDAYKITSAHLQHNIGVLEFLTKLKEGLLCT
jgi:hypothetical protein